MHAVVFHEVTKDFGTLARQPRGASGSVRAVDGVSFEVREGELLVLLGPSGCGKTTSLRMIAGLEEPDGGEISIGGKLVSSSARNIFVPTEKRNLGMVFQSYAIWPHMTVFENVAFPLRVRRTARRSIAEKVARALILVGLEGLDQRPATHLSGGQQQRVALARALVFEPRLLLLDEPLSNLDAKLRVHMRLELKELQRRTGIPSVFVTHDQAESMALADRIVVMDKGRVEQIGTAEEIYQRPLTRFVSEFVGSINLIAAEVAGRSSPDGAATLRFGSGRHELSCPWHADSPIAVGQRVLVSIRPENLTLQAERPVGQDNTWSCVIRAGVYYGDHREYEVTVGEQPFKVRTPVHVALDGGQEAFLACQSADVLIVRE